MLESEESLRGRAPQFLLVLWLACAPSQGQQPAAANTPEVSSHDAPATFSTRVNLVSVPVVVRDRQGRALGTLRQQDFQLFDKGKLQVITKFSVEKSGSPTIPAVVATNGNVPENLDAPVSASPLPERFLAYLFDDLHLSFGDLAQARNAAIKHLAESADTTTRVAIYTTSGRTTLDFTDDRDKMQETLNRIQPVEGIQLKPTDCPYLTYYMADLIQNKHDDQALNVVTQDAVICLSLDPSKAEDVAIAAQLSRATSSRVLSLGESDTHLTFTSLKDVVRRISSMPGSRSIVLVSSGFFVTIDGRPEESDLMDRAIRANVTISALDARGLYAVIPGGDSSQPGFSPLGAGQRAQYQIASASAESDAMAELAFATAGAFFHNDNGLAEGFRQLAVRPEYVYVLGFSPQNLKYDGSYHTLKVSLKDSKTTFDLHARRGYYAPKHVADPLEEAKEEIREAVFSRDELSDIPVDLNLQYFKSSDTSARVAVLARVDLRHLRFRKADDRNKNTLTIVSGLFDRNGNFVTAIEKIVDMNLRDQTLETLPASGITIRTNFDVAPGNYVVRLVVRDSEGQTMAARNGVVQIP